MNPVNKVVLTRREYKDIDELYKAVGQQIRILLDSGYTVVATKEDEMGDCIAIEYAPAGDDSWPRTFWLMRNEMLSAANTHIDNEVHNAKEIISSAETANTLVDSIFDKFKGGNGGNDAGGNFDA